MQAGYQKGVPAIFSVRLRILSRNFWGKGVGVEQTKGIVCLLLILPIITIVTAKCKGVSIIGYQYSVSKTYLVY